MCLPVLDTPPSTPGSTVTVDRPATPPTTPGSTDSSTDSAPTPGTPGGRHLSLDYIAHVIDRRCCCHCSRWYVLRKMFLEGIDAWQIEFHPNMYEVDMTFARRGPGRTSKAGSPVAMHIRCRSCKRVSKPIVHDERYGWGDLANTLYIYYREHQLFRDPRCDSGACVCGLNYCGYTNEERMQEWEDHSKRSAYLGFFCTAANCECGAVHCGLSDEAVHTAEHEW